MDDGHFTLVRQVVNFSVLASLADVVPIDAVKDLGGWHHLIKTNLKEKSADE